jgi:Fic family protein
MDHVGVMAIDPSFRWCERVILDLHFDACGFQQDQAPGLWRTGPIGVTSPEGEGLAYVGPAADQVPGLMAEVVDRLERGDLDTHVVVRAAMAHLDVISVHPFRDGNGRVSRIVQSLVLAREQLLTPELGSIEEYLGRHTPAYYAVLRETQGGSYQPKRAAGGWVAFCVEAHLEQARRRLEQLAEAGARWAHLEGLVEQRDWPDRLTIALEQSLFGGADRTSYAREADVSPATASTDFRRLLDAGMVVQSGRGRATRYAAADILLEGVREASR